MEMELKMTWKDRCDMQMKALVLSTMTIYGCTEEEAYAILHKWLCSPELFKLADEILKKDD